jgi:hypothetical protein
MKKKSIPVFKNEEQEREFWATHDSTEFIDWSKAKRAVFPNGSRKSQTDTAQSQPKPRDA